MENTTKCNITINQEESIISINNLLEDDIEINYSDDVDFTPLISVMAEHIDTGNEIKTEIDLEDIELTDKLKLILDTIGDIIIKYNENLKTPIKVDEE